MSGHVSSTELAELPRRRLSERQANTVDGLTAAAVEEIGESGYDGLTVRNVARRAGVAPATAYTYFASKDHLVAEVFWRRLQALPEPPVDRRHGALRRVTATLRDVALLLAGQPELAAACTSAMLANDADVKHVRDRIGAEIHRRLAAALGEDADDRALRALELALAGAMVQAGMGHVGYDDLPDLLAEVAGLVMR